MRRIILFLLLICIITETTAQDNYKPPKWAARFSTGILTPNNNTYFGHITDDLVGLEGNSWYLQFVYSYFFAKKWGVEFSFLSTSNEQLIYSYDRFSNSVIDRYGSNYFSTLSRDGLYNDSFGLLKVTFGPVYRNDKERVNYTLRMFVGTTTINTPMSSAILKEKGTNSIMDAKWSAGFETQDFFTLNPSLSAGYRISKRLMISIDLNTWIYKMNFSYDETIKNLISKEVTLTKYLYNDLIGEVSIGVGMMIIIK
jgi:hypothetical protein